MDYVFEVIDKTGRKIHLTRERWGEHIRLLHPYIREPEEIEQVLKSPDAVLISDRDENVKWYFRYRKDKKKYLKVSVKYLNGDGYVITAHYTRKIQ